MEGPIQLLPDWLMPDAQPDDWYQWVIGAAGHSMLGVTSFVSIREFCGAIVAWVVCLGAYLLLEFVQLFAGGSITDGLTDALFVMGGMVMADEATRKEREGFVQMVGLILLASIFGVGMRV